MRPPASFEPLLLSFRGHRVILDADLARIYGVPTKALNQAVKRNRRRFPADFAFQLSREEVAGLGPGNSVAPPANRSRSVTGSQKHRDPRFRPWAFTEHGAIMAANVLRSERAVQMSVYVARAFIRMRERLAADATILRRLAEIDATLISHDGVLRELWEQLQPLLAPPPEEPRRRIGFHAEGRSGG
jgi:hypothetical protein